MLEVEDVEDVACTVDDMEATDCSQSLVQRGWSEGKGDKGSTRDEVIEGYSQLSSVGDARPGKISITALFGPSQTSDSTRERAMYPFARPDFEITTDAPTAFSSQSH